MYTPGFFAWIGQHIHDNPSALRLKYHNNTSLGFDVDDAITQIECRQKFGSKLEDTLARDPHFIFPGVINGEQATSDRLAEWHAEFIGEYDSVADLTAGLGIDAMHMCARASEVCAIEMHPHVAEVLRYNAEEMQLDNMEVICGDCQSFLMAQQSDSFDCLFIDPARRAVDGSRVYALGDCKPDLTALQDQMLRVAPAYIAKLSPMLDMNHVAGQLHHLSELIAVGTPTECKELVAVVDRDCDEECQMRAVTLGKEGVIEEFAFTRSQEAAAECTYGMPSVGDCLMVPWPAMMKAAPLKLLAKDYGFTKIAPNTHLYWVATGDLPKSYSGEMLRPGQYLAIKAVIPYSSGEIKRFRRTWPAALVAVRNFGIPAEALRAKLGVRDAGPERVYGLTDHEGKRWLIVGTANGE